MHLVYYLDHERITTSIFQGHGFKQGDRLRRQERSIFLRTVNLSYGQMALIS